MDSTRAKLPRVIFHLDMDAFYASVEQRDNPELKGKPVIVGGSPDSRGVVCAASYEARKFGVRSAIPCSQAKRLCPQGVFVHPEFRRYKDESQHIMAIVAEAGATIEQVSIDEAYLDFSESLRRSHPDHIKSADPLLFAAVDLAKDLRARIRKERNLTASIGIAGNKLLAKLASDFNKPDGMTLIPERDKVAFLKPLPAGAIHGVGKVTAESLKRVDIHTVGDIQTYKGDLQQVVGSFGWALKRYAYGEDSRPVETCDEVKSISSENTFKKDTDNRPYLRDCLLEQADDIGTKLKKHRLSAFTVQVKVRYSDFTTLTRQLTVESPVDDPKEIYDIGCYLLRRDKLVKQPLRLLGLGVSSLTEQGATQLELPWKEATD